MFIIDTSNTVNGKPIYDLINQNNLVINATTHPSVGYLSIINSTGIIVKGLELKEDNIQGMLLAYTVNSRIENNNITFNRDGIHLLKSFNNSIQGNNIKESRYGISFWWSFNNSIYGNNITQNDLGIDLYESSNNKIWHNNFIDNVIQARARVNSINVWDDGYPSGGNYWSDHNPLDIYSGPYQDKTSSDGIGDKPYVIDGNNTDRYPLIHSYGYVPSPDLNGDDKVDIRDIAIAAKAFGSYPGHPRWNPMADVYRDGKMDI